MIPRLTPATLLGSGVALSLCGVAAFACSNETVQKNAAKIGAWIAGHYIWQRLWSTKSAIQETIRSWVVGCACLVPGTGLLAAGIVSKTKHSDYAAITGVATAILTASLVICAVWRRDKKGTSS